ncbi:MAG: hypothetical protein JNG83_00555 [Opitutaceae bacterium]|nr:hypothetical protein [Opitutaceae bacterium]
MKSSDALGFLVLGLVLGAAPIAFPEFFPPNARDGSNASALWLGLMGGVNAVLGGALLATGQLRPWLGRRPAAERAEEPAPVLRPALDGYPPAEEAGPRRLAA